MNQWIQWKGEVANRVINSLTIAEASTESRTSEPTCQKSKHNNNYKKNNVVKQNININDNNKKKRYIIIIMPYT